MGISGVSFGRWIARRVFGGAFTVAVVLALYGQAEGQSKNLCQVCDAKGMCQPKCNTNCFTCDPANGACKPVGDPCQKCDPKNGARSALCNTNCETCSAGVCSPRDANKCHACNPASGAISQIAGCTTTPSANVCQICDAKGMCKPKCNTNCETCNAGVCSPRDANKCHACNPANGMISQIAGCTTTPSANVCQVCDAKGMCKPKCNTNCETCDPSSGACKPVGDPCQKCDPATGARSPLCNTNCQNCSAGVCSAKDPNTCHACNPASGLISQIPNCTPAPAPKPTTTTPAPAPPPTTTTAHAPTPVSTATVPKPTATPAPPPPPPPPPPAPATPQVTVTPASAPPGQVITFHAAHVPPGGTVMFYPNGNAQGASYSCVADGSGACSAVYPLAATLPAGQATVLMRWPQNGVFTAGVTATYTVMPPPPPPIDGKLVIYKMDPKTKVVNTSAALTQAAPGDTVALVYNGIKIDKAVWGAGHNFSTQFLTFYATTTCGTVTIGPANGVPAPGQWPWAIPAAADQAHGYCPGTVSIYAKVPYCIANPSGPGDQCVYSATLPAGTLTIK